MYLIVGSLRRGAACFIAAVGCSALLANQAAAQTVDTTRTPPVPVVKPDSAKAVLVPTKPAAVRNAVLSALRAPPITPKRAFLYSLMIPGLGQSRLDRGTAGALFAAIEFASIAMVGKTTVDLMQARRYSVDSVPANYTVGSDGKIVGSGGFGPQFPVALVNTRRLHREDWFAALMFNHLISGADAFVAAQLWDVPTSVAVKPYADGVALVATLRW
ncbi:MAG: hypothetical protein ABI120_25145 [Gemmatimonadaceae bacterium]